MAHVLAVVLPVVAFIGVSSVRPVVVKLLRDRGSRTGRDAPDAPEQTIRMCREPDRERIRR